MPEGYVPERPYPGKNKPWMLSDAVNLGQVLVYRCYLCHRLRRYLATDLLALYGDSPAYEPIFNCGKCGHDRYLRVDGVTPEVGDYGHLPVRRPGKRVVTQTWRTVKLGDPKLPSRGGFDLGQQG